MAKSDLPPNRDDTTASFEDDVDTVPQCTGECCDPVTMVGSEYLAMSRGPDGYRNGRYMMSMLKARRPVPTHGTAEFTCKYFDLGTRRCVAYDRRPQMCRDFPEEGVCGYCGGRFTAGDHPLPPEHDAADAMEAARMRTMRTLIGLEMGRLEDAGGGTSMKPQRKSR